MEERKTKRSDEPYDLRKSRQVKRGKLEQRAAGPGQPSSQSASLRDEVFSLSRRQRRLQTELDRERSEFARLTSRCSETESHYAHLMRFYVATQRLLDAQSHEDLFEIIHEIVANLVGCDEFGVFRLDERCTLSLVSSCGIDKEKLQRIPLGSSLIGTIALKGDPYFGGEALPDLSLPQESNLTACIPLRCHGRLFGAIGIFRLLPQKVALDADDKDLLCLVGRLAAVALLCNSVFCHTVAIEAEAGSGDVAGNSGAGRHSDYG